jgi:NitT/TauT family transport system permease protein
VRVNNVPHYIIPAPSWIFTTLIDNWDAVEALWFWSSSLCWRWRRRSSAACCAIAFAMFMGGIGLFPIAVILQVAHHRDRAADPDHSNENTSALGLWCGSSPSFLILSNTVIA